MYSDNKQIRDVADVAAKIMYGQQPVTEKLHPNQQQLDVHEPEKDELTADDFKKLRAKKEVKKEEVEELDEVSLKTATSAYVARMGREDDKSPVKAVKTMDNIAKKHGVVGVARAAKAADKEYGVNDNTHNKRKDFVRGVMSNVKEDIESIDEVKMADLPSTKVQGRSYGASKPEPHAVDTLRGPKEKELKDIEAEKKKKQKKFSEMVNLYQEKGLKSLSEMLVKEEPDNEQFTKELEDAKAKSEGKKKNTEIAKGSVQAVKSEEIDINDINGVQMSTIEERMMTEPEKEKKEDIVKSMKKGMSGFKERYGDRAKEVMYATATKQAMKEETESKHYKAGHEHGSDSAQDSGFKVTARARKKEMLADNPHKKGTPEHSDWHRGANDGHQTALDNM